MLCFCGSQTILPAGKVEDEGFFVLRAEKVGDGAGFLVLQTSKIENSPHLRRTAHLRRSPTPLALLSSDLRPILQGRRSNMGVFDLRGRRSKVDPGHPCDEKRFQIQNGVGALVSI